jgi:hypothetical protein
MLPSRRTRNPARRHTTRVAHRRGSSSVAASFADIVIDFFHVWIQQWIWVGAAGGPPVELPPGKRRRAVLSAVGDPDRR